MEPSRGGTSAGVRGAGGEFTTGGGMTGAAALAGAEGTAEVAGDDLGAAGGGPETGGADFASVFPRLVFAGADFEPEVTAAGGGTIVAPPPSASVGPTVAKTGTFTSVCAGRVLR